jgi:hypothetical protein
VLTNQEFVTKYPTATVVAIYSMAGPRGVVCVEVYDGERRVALVVPDYFPYRLSIGNEVLDIPCLSSSQCIVVGDTVELGASKGYLEVIKRQQPLHGQEIMVTKQGPDANLPMALREQEITERDLQKLEQHCLTILNKEQQ